MKAEIKKSRNQESEAGRKRLLSLTSCLLAFFSPCPQTSFAQEGPDIALTEIEQLKGENVVLKLDSLDKQMRLMQAQYQQLQEQQRALVGQLQTLEAEVLSAHGIKPGEATVNWQAKNIEKLPQRRGPPPAGPGPQGGDTEKEKEEE